MTQIIEANWLAFVAVLLLGILIAWWVFARATRPAPRERRPDVLDEGVAPAQRNQALIDSPIAATIVPPSPMGAMGGFGEVIAAEKREEAVNAEAHEDARAARANEDQLGDASASARVDNLGKLKGVGPKLVTLLHSLGVTRYAQIAGWSEADIDRVDAQLGPFQGRIRRDNWVEQARLLASGDTAAYEAQFGKL